MGGNSYAAKVMSDLGQAREVSTAKENYLTHGAGDISRAGVLAGMASPARNLKKSRMRHFLSTA